MESSGNLLFSILIILRWLVFFTHIDIKVKLVDTYKGYKLVEKRASVLNLNFLTYLLKGTQNYIRLISLRMIVKIKAFKN